MPAPERLDYQPPLNLWGHIWRVLAAIAISALAWFELAKWQWAHDAGWFWVDLAAGVACLVGMHFRRRRPIAVIVLVIACSFFSATCAGPATIVLASLATRRRWDEIIPAFVGSVVAGLVFETLNPVDNGPWPVPAATTVLIIAVTVAVGMYIGSRRELLATLKQRAEDAEAEQASRVAQARTTERAVIAREMHDVLAHRMSLVAMHAGGLSYRTDLTPDQVREASAVIQDNAHQALADLRTVLGVLRGDPAGDAPNRPQPTWRDIPDLVAEANGAGMSVTYTDDLKGSTLSEQTGRTVYRIVQEGLTNARKHASDTRVRVSVGGDPSAGVLVRVSNPLRVGERATAAPESGLGLVGLAERAALSGGTLTHEVSDGREFVLEAWLPWAQ
ncbi:MAG TPA: histidine kinase [Nocardioidaceae bacterium]|nr:histidine kinase [Nocardioidaceae bacterium]